MKRTLKFSITKEKYISIRKKLDAINQLLDKGLYEKGSTVNFPIVELTLIDILNKNFHYDFIKNTDFKLIDAHEIQFNSKINSSNVSDILNKPYLKHPSGLETDKHFINLSFPLSSNTKYLVKVFRAEKQTSYEKVNSFLSKTGSIHLGVSALFLLEIKREIFNSGDKFILIDGIQDNNFKKNFKVISLHKYTNGDFALFLDDSNKTWSENNCFLHIQKI